MKTQTIVPDEILDYAPGELGPHEVMQLVDKAVARLSTSARVPPKQVVALVVLGALGGVVASKTLKGAVGLAVGAGGLLWAVRTLSKE